MKILFVNTSETTGGAAVAANRLMYALQKKDVEVAMLVRNNDTDNPNVVSINQSWLNQKVNYLRFVWERLVIFFYNKFNRENLFRVSIANTGTDISRHPLVKEADVIHLHWINQGFLSLADIEKLIKLGKPVVWTMHDMWPCTGICHYAGKCDKFQSQCRSCFFLQSQKDCDLSYKTFSKKKNIYQQASVTFVGCSDWLSQKARQSSLMKNQKVCTIPNPINISVFCPQDLIQSRIELGLPQNKKLLLFGALNVTDERKGVRYLLEAVQNIKGKQDIELVVFGKIKEDLHSLIPVPIHPMGYLRDVKKIVALYSAVDVFVTPSLEDNLPNTIMEAMACGTPCVGFNVGGIPEMIDHKKNGYIAEYMDSEDLATGIQWVLENKKALNLSKACLEKVHSSYAESVVAKKYMDIYIRHFN
ncbi:Spore coat protein SA [Bacteroidales bacterium Barb4]|nr:Spore coat protein SA [Bacteroidales bacterium Barb4]